MDDRARVFADWIDHPPEPLEPDFPREEYRLRVERARGWLRAVGWPERLVGRQGHGVFNGGGISVHPDCHLVLEPGTVVSCEPVLATEAGLFDVEDHFVVAEGGREPLHPALADALPVVAA